MQFIEVTDYAVRTVIYVLRKQGETLEFVLYPMLHIGEPQFYDDIAQQLSECDVILVENAPPSAAMSAITFCQRLLVKRKHWNLVTQHSLDLSRFRDRIIDLDIDKATFDAGWSTLPTKTKLGTLFLVPLVFVYGLLFLDKRQIAQQLELNDLPSRTEILRDNPDLEAIDGLVLHERDRHFLEKLEKYYLENRDAKLRVGILYGAAHMRAIHRFLRGKLGYLVTEAKWAVIFYL